MEYCIPLQLFILSAIILASFLSAISSKKVWLFFLGLGVVITELGIEALIRRFVEWVNCTMEKKKSAIIGKIPEPSAPPISNLSFENQKNIYNATHSSAAPMNNTLKPSAPHVNNE
jgi:hypothetical protein